MKNITLIVASCLVEIHQLKTGQNEPGRIIKCTQILIFEEELDSDEDVQLHVDLVFPLLETHEIN